MPFLVVRVAHGLLWQGVINMFATMTIAYRRAVLLDLWEAAAIIFFFSASEWLQIWCVHHTADAAAGFGAMLPEPSRPLDCSVMGLLSTVVKGDLLRSSRPRCSSTTSSTAPRASTSRC